MTDSTEEDMTMFRWNNLPCCNGHKYQEIPETEEENQGNRRKTDETGRGDAQIIFIC